VSESTVGGEWVTLPLSEFERLHEEIRRLEIEVREVKIAAGHRWCEETIYRLKQEKKELEVEVAGYRWGESNAIAESHLEGYEGELEDDDGGHESSRD